MFSNSYVSVKIFVVVEFSYCLTEKQPGNKIVNGEKDHLLIFQIRLQIRKMKRKHA